MAGYERQWGKGHVVLLMNSVRLLTVSISSSKGQMRGGSLTLGKGQSPGLVTPSLPRLLARVGGGAHPSAQEAAGTLHWDARLQGQPDEQRMVPFMENLWIMGARKPWAYSAPLQEQGPGMRRWARAWPHATARWAHSGHSLWGEDGVGLPSGQEQCPTAQDQ